jgi:hypothetical protein
LHIRQDWVFHDWWRLACGRTRSCWMAKTRMTTSGPPSPSLRRTCEGYGWPRGMMRTGVNVLMEPNELALDEIDQVIVDGVLGACLLLRRHRQLCRDLLDQSAYSPR